VNSPLARASRPTTVRPLSWEVGPTPHAAEPPRELVPAEVPGAVQLDWARAHGWPDYWVADHFRAYQGLEDSFWLYRTRLELPELTRDQRVFFVCGGVDYRFRVLLEGQVVHEQEGMFTPFEVELTGRAKTGDLLEILVFPSPKLHAEPQDRTQARRSNKPPVSYGWDWHPRLIPLGIWQTTGLEVRERVHVQSVDFQARLNEALTEAAITVTVETSASGSNDEPPPIRFRLLDPDGLEVLQSRSPNAVLHQPRLWWPAGEGKPELYTLEVLLGGVVAHAQKVGFRRVRLVMHEGAWDEPRTFPKSRSEPPITLEVNGRVIFARGSNWVCPEIFPGKITAETYRPLLTLARDAHFNLLRTWGGAIINKESFYEICDELGLLVWTEFHLACNLYDGDGEYLRVLDQESRSIIRRVRQHPSLAFWCGGNELFNAWSGMTDQTLALRLLNKNCYELDRDTPFIATAPLGGMGHGDYRFLDERGREVFQIFASARQTAYSEFGCPGPSSVEYLKTFMPAAELFPPRPGTAWETHHGLGAWEMDPGTWLCQTTIEHYFGPTESLEQLVERGELLQAEGYKCIFEEARRQKPVCSMALNWCFNEPWPSAANNNLVNWPARPKPAYFAVQAACRPVLASARVPKFSWASAEAFEAELWLLNDSPFVVAAGSLEAELEISRTRIALGSFEFTDVGENQNLRGPTVRCELPRVTAQRFTLRVRVAGRSELASEYHFIYRRIEDQHKAAPGQRSLNE
jgi:beta-mannosidase